MKKIIFYFVFLLLLFFPNFFVNAEDWASEEKTVTLITNEKLPWVRCEEIETANKDWKNVIKQYKCYLKTSSSSIISIFWSVIKWFSYIAWLIGVVFLVYGWILYSLSGISWDLNTKAKEKITQVLIWIVFLLLTWTILVLIAPWVYSPN